MATESAGELVVRAQRGDDRAFAALYEHHAPAVYRFLRRRLRGPDALVEDLTADVFVKAYDKLDRFTDRGVPFSAWLYRIARNHLVDHLRLQSKEAACSLDTVIEMAERRAPSAYGQVLDRQVLGPALARLTDEQRQVIRLRFFDGQDVAETAAATGHSYEAVKKLQARGLAALRRILVAEGLEPGPRAGLAVA